MSVDTLPGLKDAILSHQKSINKVGPREQPEAVECRILVNNILGQLGHKNPMHAGIELGGKRFNLLIDDDPYNMRALEGFFARIETGVRIGGTPHFFRSIEAGMVRIWGVEEK